MNNNKTTSGLPSPVIQEVSNRRQFESRQLFAEQQEISILHAGEEYRLRITSNGKLILTK